MDGRDVGYAVQQHEAHHDGEVPQAGAEQGPGSDLGGVLVEGQCLGGKRARYDGILHGCKSQCKILHSL